MTPEVTPDWKPTPRLVAPNAGRRKVASENRCRVCKRRGGRHVTNRGRGPFEYVRLSRHHLVPKGGKNRGDDMDANIVPLCGSGTTGCHGLIEAHDHDARVKLRTTLTIDEIAYIIDKQGEAWLDEHYPAA